MAREHEGLVGDLGEGIAGASGNLADSYRRLELALVEAATASLTRRGLPEGAPLVSAETAVKLLMLRGAGGNRGSDGLTIALDPEALRTTLSARIAAVRHVAARPAAPPPPAE